MTTMMPPTSTLPGALASSPITPGTGRYRWALPIAGSTALVLVLTACEQSPPAEAPRVDRPSSASASDDAAARRADANAAPTTEHLPWFENVAAEHGLTAAHESGVRPGRLLLPEITGGGGAMYDLDGDGWPDVLIIQGGALDEPPQQRPMDRLYRNVRGERFEDVTDQSGMRGREHGMGVAIGDIDNDGRPDVYVTNVGRNALYRNLGAMRFERIESEGGAEDNGWSTAAAFVDINRNGDLDLFVVRYITWSLETERECSGPGGGADYCAPNSYAAPLPDALFLNDGTGHFRDVSAESGISESLGNGLGILVLDVNNDGWPDIFVANDGTPNHLWINHGDGTFTNDAFILGCAIDQDGIPKAGMGVAAWDLDGDGRCDILVVNLTGETDSLYMGSERGFIDRTARSGLRTISRRFTRFGVGFADFTNDGNPEIFQAAGSVRLEIGREGMEDPYAEPNLIMAMDDEGRFTEVLPRGGTRDAHLRTSRAAIFGDFDNDGGIDILVINRDAPPDLLRNVHPSRGNWIMIDVRERSGRSALGARVIAEAVAPPNGSRRTIVRDVRSAYSYLAANDPRIHIGLGEATELENIRIRWADGEEEAIGNLKAGEVHVVRRDRWLP